MPNRDKEAHDAAAAAITAMQAVGLLVAWTVGRGAGERRASGAGTSTEEGSSDDWENGDPLLKEDITSPCLAWPSKTKQRCDAAALCTSGE